MLPYDDAEARQHVEEIDAKVLSNRKPPYPIIGGLFDAMMDAGGDVLLVDNEAARSAAALFEALEGTDIHPAAAVAVASLIQAVQASRVPEDSTVMLNITGGGEARYKAEHELTYLTPDFILPANTPTEEIRQKVEQLKW
jgi:cysteate synthase